MIKQQSQIRSSLHDKRQTSLCVMQQIRQIVLKRVVSAGKLLFCCCCQMTSFFSSFLFCLFGIRLQKTKEKKKERINPNLWMLSLCTSLITLPTSPCHAPHGAVLTRGKAQPLSLCLFGFGLCFGLVCCWFLFGSKSHLRNHANKQHIVPVIGEQEIFSN